MIADLEHVREEELAVNNEEFVGELISIAAQRVARVSKSSLRINMAAYRHD